MKLLLIGSGGVGVYFCGRAAQGGAEVEAVIHSGWEKISKCGFQVQSIAGDFSFRPAKLLHSPQECSNDIDAVVLATKVLKDIDRVALLEYAANLPSRPPLVLIQNGVGIEEEIAAAFPENEIISVIAYIGVSRTAPEKIVHTGAGRLILGKFASGECDTAEKIAAVFRAGNVECCVTDDIALARWQKLLWNLPFNPVSVLGGGLHTGLLCDGGKVENLCLSLMREVIAVANAAGVPLTEKMAQEQIEYTRNFPPYRTSMLQDFDAGRALEVDAIMGNAVKMAERLGVDVPVMRCCSTLLESCDRMNRSRAVGKVN